MGYFFDHFDALQFVEWLTAKSIFLDAELNSSFLLVKTLLVKLNLRIVDLPVKVDPSVFFFLVSMVLKNPAGVDSSWLITNQQRQFVSA